MSQSVRALLLMLVVMNAGAAHGQTTTFTYQGQLSDAGGLATGSYDLRFALFDSAAGGAQIGANQTVPAVPVSEGVFTVQLDFGVNAFPGANRFVEISVKPAAGGSFTTLAPRQQISSAPYAIRTLSAATADALSGTCTGCVHDTQIQSVAGSKVSGTIPAASVPTGSGNYIQNTTTQQANANFNVSGNGTAGGTLSASVVAATERMGIGTSNSPARLTVSGSGAYNAAGASRFDLFNATAGTGFLQHVSDSGLWQIATTGGVTRMVMTPDGNLGIGTVSPTSKLEIGAQDGLAISGFQPFLTLRDTNAGNKRGFVQSVNGDTVLLTDTRAALVVQDGSGNVGIGTANPLHKLHIQGEGAGGYSLGITGNATQNSDKSGFVKALVYVEQDGRIARCFNSTITGIGATAVPCGFTVSDSPVGHYTIDFRFQVGARFISLTTINNLESGGCVGGGVTLSSLSGTSASVTAFCADNFYDRPFMAIVY